MAAGERVVRIAAGQPRAEEWALVLASAGIPHHLRTESTHWVVAVPADDERRAAAALDAYDRENPGRTTGAQEYGRTWAGIGVAVALLGFFFVTGVPGATGWSRAGEAVAARILDGEVWRAVTALTLHANLPHVVSNAVACAVFVTAVCWALGPGVGLWLVLLAGAGGNLFNALVRGAPHRAIGASTAVFGAVGILGALQYMNRQRRGVIGRRAWVPVAAALGLLAMLGTAVTTDILAHLFGFLTGGVLGIVVSVTLPRPPARASQLALASGAVVLVLAAWAMALR